MLDLIISVASAVILLILGFGFGRYIEKKHYANLIEREQSTLHFPLVNMRTHID